MNAAKKAFMSEKPSIYVEDLVIDFALDNAIFNKQYMRAVNKVSFILKAGEALAIVGESGSGKSTCARALCRLYQPTSGNIWLQDINVNEKKNQMNQRDYAKEVQMIFQDPFGSLNAVHTIHHHLARPLKIHHPSLSVDEIEKRVIELLERVGLTPAKQTANKYPHELSGGQRQRVSIARALAVGANFILADEPISMLDVSIRLGILNLMEDMKQDGIGFMYITHDIATARYFAERTAVMYVGHMVEWGNSDSVTQNPQHPYTQLLISAVPEPGIRKERTEMAKKAEIPLWKPESKGCPFANRCLKAVEECRESMPPVTQLAEDHFVRCYLY
ncbi:ABC transporter ATP-binding protein [Reinekea marina]|uniref:ABC transporter ATP-binding protein n=1 Tax=Reinekea marina TaxID=1310421 RepID=A0ABV7WNJ8_9GAMM|nr:ABC transporter ATP-binding protein [Reinekea marina]MDN3647914.1 ABC transporter ATP-binding protein [Reinekea marina]